MTLLSVSNVSKSYGDHQVLNNVTLTIERGTKCGLVGANGVGKSTLLKIIAGEVEPDSGSVQIRSDAQLGYLPQVISAPAHQTIDDLIRTAHERLHGLERRLRMLEADMAQGGALLDELLLDYSRTTEEFDRLGGYTLTHDIDRIFTGLGVAHLRRDRRVETLSGGEKARIGLAMLLLKGGDLLLLDEPTNHLDFAALRWLEEFLRTIDAALLVVSHDRAFLNGVINTIVEIDEQSAEVIAYAGNYDVYAAEKARQRARWVAEYWAQQEEIHELRRMISSSSRQVAHNRPSSDGDKLAYNFKGQRVEATISRNVRAAEERLRRIEEEPIPKPPKPIDISPEFNPADMASKTPLSVSQVSIAFGGRLILDEITCTLGPASRIVIVGANGAGKSTLLKIMAGRLQPDSGSVTRAPGVAIGYLDQEQETLARTGTTLDAYGNGLVGAREDLVRDIIGYGLFTYADLLKPVAALSVGQQRKLQLAQLIARRANLLLLDEPTNHISFDVLEEFEEALVHFPGPVVAISHDRRFIERMAGELWEMAHGWLTRYLGGWEEFESRQ